MLRLDHSSTFSGTIFKFTGNGKLSGSDQIDLKDIKYSSVHDSYANNVLTVTDGSGDAAKLHFNGSYTLANFKFANDGSGGTIVYDPPATPSSGQNTAASGPLVPSATIGKSETPESMDLPGIAFNVQSTLGYLANSNQAGAIPSIAEGVHNANVGLLGNYMASMFAVPSDHGAITTLAEAGLGELRAPFCCFAEPKSCCFAEPKRRKSTRDHWMKLGLGPRLYRRIVISSF